MTEEAISVAVGLVPGRQDGLISLHVGNSYILLNKEEAQRVGSDLLKLSGPRSEDRAAS